MPERQPPEAVPKCAEASVLGVLTGVIGKSRQPSRWRLLRASDCRRTVACCTLQCSAFPPPGNRD